MSDPKFLKAGLSLKVLIKGIYQTLYKEKRIFNHVIIKLDFYVVYLFISRFFKFLSYFYTFTCMFIELCKDNDWCLFLFDVQNKKCVYEI